jgi:hypothetical protein
MSENGTQNLAQACEADVSQEHRETLPNQSAPPLFEQAILRLVPLKTHRDICALFDNRVGYQTIKHWRRGRHRPPDWIWQRLNELFRKRVAETEALLAQVHAQSAAAAQYEALHPRGNIKHYNRDRFTKREKASESAGP